MISLADAKRIIAAAEREAESIGRPMNIAVVDGGGNLVAHVRMGGGWIGSMEVAIDKAWTARAVETSTKDMAQFTQSGGIFFGIHSANDGRVLTFSGGMPW